MTRSTLTEPTTTTRPGIERASARDVLAAVDADDVAGDEIKPLARQRYDRVRDVLRRRHPSGRVSAGARLDDRVVFGDLHQRRRHRHAGPDRIHADPRALLRELHRELPAMRLERGLGR